MKTTLKIGAVAAAFTFFAAPAFAATGAEVLKALNKDSDSTLEISEVIHAGVAVYTAINTDGDQTLEANETKGRVTEKEWKKANTDGDKTLEMDEWLKILRQRFKAADKDHDGSLDAAELDTKAGQAVVVMIVK